MELRNIKLIICSISVQPQELLIRKTPLLGSGIRMGGGAPGAGTSPYSMYT